MTRIASQITSLTVVYSTVYSDADQRKIKAPRHWPLCVEFIGTGEFPTQRASFAENASIWWRHHVVNAPLTKRFHVVTSWCKVYDVVCDVCAICEGYQLSRCREISRDLIGHFDQCRMSKTSDPKSSTGKWIVFNLGLITAAADGLVHSKVTAGELCSTLHTKTPLYVPSVCTSRKCWGIYRTPSNCCWSIYRTSRKRRGILWVVHKI